MTSSQRIKELRREIRALTVFLQTNLTELEKSCRTEIGRELVGRQKKLIQKRLDRAGREIKSIEEAESLAAFHKRRAKKYGYLPEITLLKLAIVDDSENLGNTNGGAGKHAYQTAPDRS